MWRRRECPCSEPQGQPQLQRRVGELLRQLSSLVIEGQPQHSSKAISFSLELSSLVIEGQPQRIRSSRVITVMVRVMLVTLLVPALLMSMMMIAVVPMIMRVPMPMRTFIGLERRRHLDGPEPVLSH
jgi:hypothetical protein